MSPRTESPYASLDRIFHEPNRLAILSTLLGAARAVSFAEIKEACNLTDGNLSRHLKALEEAGVISIDKRFVGSRPKTTARLSSRGRQKFLQYLEALEKVIAEAAARADAQAERRADARANARADARADRESAGRREPPFPAGARLSPA